MTERSALTLRHVLSSGDTEALATLMSELEGSHAAGSLAYARARLSGSRASICNARLR